MGETYHSTSLPSGSGVNNIVPENFITNSRLGVFSSSTCENVGSDLVSNGAFSSDATGWTAVDCTIASVAGGQAGNCLEITRTGADIQYAHQTITVVANHTYKISGYIKSGTSGNESGALYIYEGETILTSLGGTSSGDWTAFTAYFKPSTTSVVVRIVKQSATAGTMLFDTVSIYDQTPAYVGADQVAPDGWTKATTMSLYREYSGENTAYGSFYGIKGSVSAGCYLYWSDSARHADVDFMARFKGKTIVVGCLLKTSTASHIYIAYYDGSWHDLTGAHPGDGKYWWMEARYVMPTSATATIPFAIHAAQASGDFYMTQPMGIIGNSIGYGNFAPIQNETIFLNAHQNSYRLGNNVVHSDLDFTDISVEADSSLAIPKDIRRVLVRAAVKDSGSAAADCYMQFRQNGDGGNNIDGQLSCGGLANGMTAYAAPMWVNVDNTGIYEYKVEASGSSTFTVVGLYYLAVQY
ncbi:MAG: carbohydrate binding domain-containing protein [Dehalococcoidia bacterium]|jgi:hypothetical protein